MSITQEQLVAALKEKLDNEEKFIALWRSFSVSYAPTEYFSCDRQLKGPSVDGVYSGDTIFRKGDESWWFAREQLRIHAGVYPERTEVMSRLVQSFQLGQYCIHPSSDPETPFAVCYTPDSTFGRQDRQLKLASLAKLIKRLCILVTDEHAQKLEAMHRAEMDDTFLIATTVEDVERVYRTMDGDSGCMRKDPEYWDLDDSCHPSHVYAEVPGMGVAYTEVDGVVKSRAVVWEDPTGGKHYLRVYGDGSLKRKLERAGYVLSSLAGAKIRAVVAERADPDETHSDYYIVPYLDGRGGAQDNRDGTYGYIDADDPGFIQLVTEGQYYKLSDAGIEVRSFKDYDDNIKEMYPQDLSSLRFTCPLSGIEVDKLRDSTTEVYTRGQKLTVLATTYAFGRFNTAAKHRIDYETDVVRIDPAEYPVFLDMNEVRWIDTPENRKHRGYVQLSEKYYSDRSWRLTGSCVNTSDGWQLVTDVVTVYDRGSEVRHVRAEVTPAFTRSMSRQGYFAVGTTDKRYYIHPEHTSAVSLHDGQVVHKALHEVTQTWDGQWAYKRQVGVVFMYGRKYKVLKQSPALPSPQQVLDDVVKGYAGRYDKLMEHISESYAVSTTKERVLYAKRSMLNNACHGSTFDIENGAPVPKSWYMIANKEPDLRRIVGAMTDEIKAQLDKDQLHWFEFITLLVALFDKFDAVVAQKEQAEREQQEAAEAMQRAAQAAAEEAKSREMGELLAMAQSAGIDTARYQIGLGLTGTGTGPTFLATHMATPTI